MVNNDSNDEIEEEIKEEIEITEKETPIESTYDKFLLESNAFEGKQKNAMQSELKNQMKNIIYDMKEKKAETQKIKSNLKRQILKDLSSKFADFPQEDINNIEQPNIEENEYEGEFEKDNLDEQFKNDLMIENNDDINDNLYNINLEEYSKENIVEHNEEKKEDLLNKNESEEHRDISKIITNQNETVTNPYIENSAIDYNRNINCNNFSQHEDNTLSLEQQIQQNYTHFLRNIQKSNENNKQRPKIYENNPKENNYIKNTKEQRLIVVDSYQNDDERREKNLKLEKLKQQKIKKLESLNQQKRNKSKGKVPLTISSKQNGNNKISIPSNNKKPIRPSTAKKIVKQPQINSNNRPSTSKSNAKVIPTSNDTSNISSTVNESNISRIPIKIKSEKSFLANQRIKNFKCSKMSNKSTIKKAIKEVCLAGLHYKDSREQILEIIDKCESENYIILFKGNNGFYLSGVYTYEVGNQQIELLTCINNAPNFIYNTMVERYYKFNISQNQFKELPGNKEFSVIVDGIIISKH